jgi:hypothetical protein
MKRKTGGDEIATQKNHLKTNWLKWVGQSSQKQFF